MKTKLLSLVLVLALLAGFAFAPFTAPAADAQATGLSVPITNAPVSGNSIGTFTGTLDITRFVNQGGQLAAQGILNGVVTTATGTINIVNQAVTVPVTAAQASCDILTLNLGPLHLDLLGLVIDLSAVNLAITAVSGAGNLLGNLLCAVANLLNNGGPLSSVVGLLNNILRQL